MGHSRSYYLSNSDTSFCKLIIYCTEEVTFFYFTLLFLLYTIFYINNIYIYIYFYNIILLTRFFFQHLLFCLLSICLISLSLPFPLFSSSSFFFFLSRSKPRRTRARTPSKREREGLVWFGLLPLSSLQPRPL